MNKSLLFAVCLCTTFNVSAQGAQQDKLKDNAGGWPVWGGDAGGTRFSPLRDITKENVDTLQVAWEYHTGDSSEHKPGTPPSSFLATPVLHDNTLYFCSGLSRAFAVDAETGEERWVFDSKPRIDSPWTAKCRGVALWQDRAAQDRAAQRRTVVSKRAARRRVAHRSQMPHCRARRACSWVRWTPGWWRLTPAPAPPARISARMVKST
ncbi:MAG: PQQ-binding-like beta-propeller repeat protein [Haliea sp.]|nr:PQQ-binding-like beta-propeller repeat protein [Haliea sp.]